jgi:hypothetical protein
LKLLILVQKLRLGRYHLTQNVCEIMILIKEIEEINSSLTLTTKEFRYQNCLHVKKGPAVNQIPDQEI